jgi:predicted Rossmann fold nucleotide-binding protein DprA/Smf involved in DNA uptake
MSDDFRYSEAAQALDDNLEEVLESHKQEQEEKQAEEASKLPQEPPALERIARGDIPLDQVNQVAGQKQKKSSDVIAEHRVRSMLRDGAEARVAVVDDFITEIKAQA